jgi:hypothetical protein
MPRIWASRKPLRREDATEAPPLEPFAAERAAIEADVMHRLRRRAEAGR